MPDASRIVPLIRKAAILGRASSTRRGMVAELPADSEDLLIAGDLHGNLDNFRWILEQADLANRPRRHLVLQEFVHGKGQYSNGGCQSHRLLDALSALKCQFPDRVHLLLGNHELAQWTGRKVAKDGIYLNDLFELGVKAAYGPAAEEVVDAYDDLFASMLLGVRSPNGVLAVHSIPEARFQGDFDVTVLERMGLREDDVEKGSSAYRLVWGKDVRPETSEAFREMIEAQWLVTGHIAQEKGYTFPGPRHLIVDCCSLPAACVLLPTQGDVDRPMVESGIHIRPIE